MARKNTGSTSGRPGSAGQAGDFTTDRRLGLYGGRRVAKPFLSSDGWTILVGLGSSDNDILSLKLGRPYDFWLHIASGSGAHVVVLNEEKASRLPRATQSEAAALAAGHSKARDGGRVAVHLATCQDVSKPRGAPAGRVAVRRGSIVHERPRRDLD